MDAALSANVQACDSVLTARETHPRHPEDIEDIEDIFGDGDFHTQDTLSCACFVDAIGEPLLRTVRAASVCRPAGNPSRSTYEAPTVSVLATVRHFRTVATAVIDAGKLVCAANTRNPPLVHARAQKRAL